jgi:hypothetical protein
MAATLIKNKFKFDLELKGTSPFATQVSLYDLLFDSNGEFRYDIYAGTLNGWNLKDAKTNFEHNLIVYNGNIYQSDGSVNMISSTEDAYKQYGIDIAPVEFDPRSKSLFIEDSNFKVDKNNGNKRGYVKYDKNASLYPSGLDWWYSTVNVGSRPWYSSQATGDFSTAPLVSVGLLGETSYKSVIVLNDKDSVFQQIITTMDGFSNYTSLALNPSNDQTWKIVDYLLNIDTTKISVNEDISITDYQTFYKKHNIQEYLKSTYVWLKCSVYGDYIREKDFNQILNQSADVQFKNINIGLKSDFNNYDELAEATGDNLSENSLAYLPKTAPGIDLHSRDFFADFGDSSIDVKTAVKEVIDSTLDSDNSNLKGLNAAINRTSAANGEISNFDHLSPPGYFDPESRLDASAYTDKPILFEDDGTFRSKGRILNVSIDEIWNYTKRLVYGRKADTNSDTPSILTGEIFALNESQTQTDTYAYPARKDTFAYKNGETVEAKQGDVLDWSYKTTNAKLQAIVNSFVSNPKAIKYNILTELENLSKEIIGDKSDRDIKNFLPWMISEDGTFQTDSVEENTAITVGFWSARNNPLSLTEAELWIKMLRYNFISQARFVKENFVVDGGLGRKTNTTDEISKTAGSLYQLHNKYNFKVNDPNTIVDVTKIIYDPEGNYLNDNVVVLRDNQYNYGSSKELPESSKAFSTSDVYLAADGTWRYLFDHVRVPVLDTIEEPY